MMFLAAVNLLGLKLAAQTTVYQTAGNNNWSSASWSAGLPNTSTETAVFNQTTGAARTVTVNSNYSIAGILFNGTTTPTTYSIGKTSGGANTLTLNSANSIVSSSSAAQTVGGSSLRLTLAASTAFSVDGTGDLTINPNRITNAGFAITLNGTGSGNGNVTSNITGTGGLNVTAGNWALGGISTYTGITNLTGGTLSISAEDQLGGNPGAFQAGQLTLNGGTLNTSATFSIDDTNRGLTLGASGGTFSVNTGTTLTIASTNIIAGSGGSLTKTGDGGLTLNAVNTFTGGTTVTAGTLTLGHASNTLADSGTVLVNGGTLAIGANSDSVGAVTLSSGSITGSTGVLTGTSYSLTDTGTISAILGGSGTLTKTGAGTVTLSAANTLSGNITVSEGTLRLQNDNALGTRAITENVTVQNGAVLQLDGGRSVTGGNLTLSGTGTGAGALVGSNGNNRWNDNIELAGNTTITTSGTGYLALGQQTTAHVRATNVTPVDPSRVVLGSNTLTLTGTTSTLTAAAPTDQYRAIYVNGRITGAGNILINMDRPEDMVRYTANFNDYTGTTTINKGTLSLRTLGNSYPGDVTTGNLNYFAINGNITIGNGTDAANSAVLLMQTDADSVNYSEQINYNAKVFINKSGLFHLLNSQSITGLEFTGGAIDLGTVGGLYLSGASGAGDVIVNASPGNTATISGTGTSTLSLTIHQGPVPIPNANRRFIVAEGNGGTVSDLTISARITNGSITKMGDGLMTISSANSGGYEGTTTVAAGILSAQNNTALGQTDGLVGTGTSVTSGATLQLSNAANGNLTITGEKLTLAGDGYGSRGALQNLIGNNTWAGTANITLSANSTIKSDADLFTISSNITSSASSSLTVAGAGNTTISGIIDSGVVGVTKSGTGTLILSANNDYTGTTTINTGGVLSAQAANALGATGTGTTVNSGGALYIDNTAIGGGANQLTVNAEPLSIAGTGVGSTGALRNVAGNNSFLGPVTVASSALVTSNASQSFTLGGGVNSTAGSSQTLTIGTTAQNGDITIAGDMSLGASYTTAVNLTKEGTGTLTFAKPGATLTGTVGAVQLNNGTISIGTAGMVDTITTGAFTSKGVVDGLASNTTLTIASGAIVNANYTASTNLFNGVLAGAGTFNAIGAADNAGITFGTSFAATNITLKVGSTSVGSTNLNDYFKVSFGTGVSITVDTLEITGDTILDFGNGVNTLTSTNLIISNPNAKVYVMNWTSLSDAWYVNSQVNGSSHTANVFGGIPLDQITFQNYNGLTTTWVSGTVQGWLHNEIRPTPEPSTYGAILVSGCLGLLGWRRYRRSHPASK